ncbi:type VII toxin-antitoxin system MntA family adenylyltransferase antitoxin [Hathewaya massiliensis]|uniref:type VII toxin-antitoxin system MntA family adenylyltransferase antitoxin n=1 Tax=Hathewaya massiliensis TaxID=1964382 RepID=UPI001158D2D1|nr:nucleotidyltransferase domain-containing protein [Hathewaya massiliensis]
MRNKVKDILDTKGIDVCFLFGSYGTSSFNESSDIDIAILGDIDFIDTLPLIEKLESELNREVDLVKADEVYPIIQLAIAHRGDVVFCKDHRKLEEFLAKAQKWYEEEYRFWKKWYEEEY